MLLVLSLPPSWRARCSWGMLAKLLSGSRRRTTTRPATFPLSNSVAPGTSHAGTASLQPLAAWSRHSSPRLHSSLPCRRYIDQITTRYNRPIMMTGALQCALCRLQTGAAASACEEGTIRTRSSEQGQLCRGATLPLRQSLDATRQLPTCTTPPTSCGRRWRSWTATHASSGGRLRTAHGRGRRTGRCSVALACCVDHLMSDSV